MKKINFYVITVISAMLLFSSVTFAGEVNTPPFKSSVEVLNSYLGEEVVTTMTTTSTYDEKGNVINSIVETDYMDGYDPIVCNYDYLITYNDQGLIEVQDMIIDGKLFSHRSYVYDEQRNPVSAVDETEFTTYSFTYENEYNDAGQLISKTEHVISTFSDDSQMENVAIYVYTYNSEGLLETIETYNTEDATRPDSITSYEYYEDGLMANETNTYVQFDGEESIMVTNYSYLFNPDGTVSSIIKEGYASTPFDSDSKMDAVVNYIY